ncbi:MAG TPA: AAA family ATPase [Thermomicrobiales bacterium]|nr:AAA family ATPase [Thermomicrobiales bacterium]
MTAKATASENGSPVQPDTPHVFISYDREDAPFARVVREHLAAHGIATWMDQYDIQPGAYWPDAIDAALSSAETVVGVLSPQAVESRNVKNEWDWAIQHERRLLLLQVEPCEVPHRYISLNFIDATEPNRPAALETLTRSLVIALAPESNDTARLAPTAMPRPRARIRPQPVNVIAGREREREQLRETLERALSGAGSLVLISGEAGIGKTTLVEDLALRAEEHGALVLSGGCYDLTTTPPYGPWVELIAGYPADGSLPPLPEQLRSGGGMAGIDSQVALFDLATRWFQDVATAQPLALVLEDLHWADSASLDLLRHVARSIGDSRLLLIATYRDDEITREHPLAPLLPPLVRESGAQRIGLQRLDGTAVLEMARQRYLLDPAAESRLLDYLDRMAEGNPFFTNELLYTLEANRLLSPVAGGWALGDLSDTGVPSLIQYVIDRRLARLGDGARSLLDMAAVVGFEAPLDLLLDLLPVGAEQVDAAVEQASQHHLLRVAAKQRAARFTHALIRQALYEAIPVLRRPQLHLKVGDALAARPRADAAAVASHYYAAGDVRALGWLEQAAERSQSLFAPQSVIDYASMGIDLAIRLGADASTALYRMRGLAHEALGDFEGALHDHEKILFLASGLDDRRPEWQALLDLAALWASRDYQRTRDYCEQAVVLAREMDDPAALGHSLNRLGNWHLNSERPGEAIRLHDEALRLFEAIDDRQGIASTLDLAAISNLISGSSGEAVRLWERAVPLLRQLDDRQNLCSALSNATTAPRGGYGFRASRVLSHPASIGKSSEDTATEAIRIARSIDSRGHECFALGVLGQNVATLGDVRGGLQHMSDALAIADDIQHHLWSALIHISLGESYLDMLIAERASDLLQHALDRATQMAATFQAACSAGFLASAHVVSGDYDRAEQLLRDRVDRARPPASMSARVCWFAAVELALARGNPADALTTIETLIESIPDGPGDLSPYLTRLYGEILLAHGRLDDAERELRNAHEVATRLNYPLALWRVLATQRRLALARGQHDQADRADTDAREIIDGLASQLDDEEMREAFLSRALAKLHEPPPAIEPRSAENPAGLTAREIEVLRLVTDGLTDIEVSERLFISPRTVSQHLRSVYGKLDVNNRTAAVRAARDLGVV